jgi:hypothetical protein
MHYTFASFLIDFEKKHSKISHSNSANNQKAAVIVEWRPDYFLPAVMKNFAYFLGKDWNFHFVGTDMNERFIKESLSHWQFHFHKLNMIKPDFKTYQQVLKSKDFWQLFPEDKLLIFQLDCILCSELELRFLDYDYIGAPSGPNAAFMNGGLSLRSRQAMLAAIDKMSFFVTDELEDIFFTKALKLLNAKLPDIQTAAEFSVESFYVKKPFGVHGTNKYYFTDEIAKKIISEIYY